MLTKILLDMDGVLADFLHGMELLHGRKLPYDKKENLGVWETEKLWGMSSKEFWRPTNFSQKFWETLPITPEADEIVEMAGELVGMRNVAILTAPSKDMYCIPGKKAWVKANYPQLADKVIFAGPKTKCFCAASTHLLVDDKDGNVDSFRTAGGQAVLVPRLWNREYQTVLTCKDIALGITQEMIRLGK